MTNIVTDRYEMIRAKQKEQRDAASIEFPWANNRLINALILSKITTETQLEERFAKDGLIGARLMGQKSRGQIARYLGVRIQTGRKTIAMQPIETAPKDGSEILVFAVWDLDAMYGESSDKPASWQLASWTADEFFQKPGFWSITFTPYSCIAISPTHWMMPLAPTGEAS